MHEPQIRLYAAIAHIPRFSTTVTVLRGTFRVVPRQEHLSLFPDKTLMSTPNPLRLITITVSELIKKGSKSLR